MTVYSIQKSRLIQFGQPNKPFLSFDQYGNLVQYVRDELFAVDRMPQFVEEIGVEYNLWTREAHSKYYRNLFFDDVGEAVQVAIRIPNLSNRVTFFIEFTVFDSGGVYFIHEQEIAVTRIIFDRQVTTSWKKVPNLKKAILNQYEDWAAVA